MQNFEDKLKEIEQRKKVAEEQKRAAEEFAREIEEQEKLLEEQRKEQEAIEAAAAETAAELAKITPTAMAMVGEVVTQHVIRIAIDADTVNNEWIVHDAAEYDNVIQTLRNMKPSLELGRNLFTISEAWLFGMVVTNLLVSLMLILLFVRLGWV